MSAVRKLRTVVITGAGTGLGRAAALELAAPGCSLVLAARDVAALEDAAMRAREAGAEVIVVECDVTDSSDVVRLAASAVDEFGAIDVWINHGTTTLHAALEEGSLEQHEEVIRDSLFGALHGARAVLPIFRRQHHGILINIGSVLGENGQTIAPAHVVSTFGLHGLSEALRIEVADEPDIHISTVFPYALDIEMVGREVARLVDRPRRMRFVPRRSRLALALHALAPRTTERLVLDRIRRHYDDDRGVTRRFASLVGRLARIEAESAARFASRTLRHFREQRQLRRLARAEAT